MILRGISFSDVMVRQLRAGVKTQTRRLASSPLARLQLGDLLYVREAFHLPQRFDQLGPLKALQAGATIAAWSDDVATLARDTGRRRFAREMPKVLHRQHLVVTAVRREPLQAITDADAEAEGIVFGDWTVAATYSDENGWAASADHALLLGVGATPRDGFARLWDSLHAGRASLTARGRGRTRWADNPTVAAITFRVVDAPVLA